MRDQVSAHMKQDYRFVCLTNEMRQSLDGVEFWRLRQNWGGWWHKIELFDQERLRDRALYLDLDVTVTGNLDDLANYRGDLVAVDDWHLPGLNTSVMAWNPEPCRFIAHRFNFGEWVSKIAGDQDWISRTAHGVVTFPPDWCISYKRAARNNDWPDDARVICYHGRPKPWDAHEPIPEKYSRAA